ncbi:DEAD-box ATP-dependent RNA helicase [Acrasis kona]|uniref:RNA helicase n=1 Tax=Acrasis kona TaxID=1008807 RepID=A0AAW2YYM0_9EUKA
MDAIDEWQRIREQREKERLNREQLLKRSRDDEQKNEEEENANKRAKLLEERIRLATKKPEEEQVELDPDQIANIERSKMSLLQKTKKLREQEPILTEKEREEQMEKTILDVESARAPLAPVKQLASGVMFDQVDSSLIHSTRWKPPRQFASMSEMEADSLRRKYRIEVIGEKVPPPIPSFRCMRFPPPIIQALRAKHIKKPTPIQTQALPVVLCGRDLIGIAFTGSGKTLVFSLPMIMYALAEEIKMPLAKGEGPFGVIICPSRELAYQTHQVICQILSFFDQDYPKLNCMLCMGGGASSRDAQAPPTSSAYHMVVATPGRFMHLLSEKKIHLKQCKYIALDEADHLIDTGFEEDIRAIFDYLPPDKPRQTVLFSATMPEKIRRFAEQSLTRPITVNVGRAGAANLDVVQEIEYVKQEAKMVYLLQCLQKTAPPVLIFCENKSDVDDIHEYLLLKGVEVCSIHGGKTQSERLDAIDRFRDQTKDVLVATDVASKGLDFPNVQHVINYDTPREIENYVHRIGRTGRRGKTGLATTFVNNTQCSEAILMDLKHLLMEARQVVPSFMMQMGEQQEMNVGYRVGGQRSVCSYCSGPGHSIINCPKREREKNEQFRKISATDSGLGGGDY